MRIVQLLMVSLGTAVLAMVALYVSSYFVFQGNGTILPRLQEAYKNEKLVIKQDYGPLSPFMGGNPQFIFRHDCLIWGMLIAPYDSALDQAMRNHNLIREKQKVEDRLLPNSPDCQALSPFIAPSATQALPRLNYYDRYILGHKLVAAFLLQRMEPWAAAKVLFCISFGLLGVLLLLIPLKKPAPDVALPLAGWAFVFMLFYGLSHYAKMAYFAPMEWGHFLFLIAVLLKSDAKDFWQKTMPLLAAIYGCWIAIFEFLTGGIPLALALIVLVHSFANEDRKTFIKKMIMSLAAFVLACLFCFAIKIGLTLAFSGGDILGSSTEALLQRLMGGAIKEVSPVFGRLLQEHGYGLDFVRGTLVGNILLAVLEYGFWGKVLGQGSPFFWRRRYYCFHACFAARCRKKMEKQDAG
jgi:hypothetical protein